MATRRMRPAIWSLVSLMAASGLIAAIIFGHSNGSVQEDHAVNVTDTVIRQLLQGGKLQSPITGDAYSQMLDNFKAQVLSDPRIIQVSIWNPDTNVIVFSTYASLVGRPVGAEAHVLSLASQGDVQSGVTKGFPGGPSLYFRTFAPLKFSPDEPAVAVVEIDQPLVEGGIARLWTLGKVAFGLALVISLARLWVLLGEPSPVKKEGIWMEPGAPKPSGPGGRRARFARQGRLRTPSAGFRKQPLSVHRRQCRRRLGWVPGPKLQRIPEADPPAKQRQGVGQLGIRRLGRLLRLRSVVGVARPTLPRCERRCLIWTKGKPSPVGGPRSAKRESALSRPRWSPPKLPGSRPRPGFTLKRPRNPV